MIIFSVLGRWNEMTAKTEWSDDESGLSQESVLLLLTPLLTPSDRLFALNGRPIPFTVTQLLSAITQGLPTSFSGSLPAQRLLN